MLLIDDELEVCGCLAMILIDGVRRKFKIHVFLLWPKITLRRGKDFEFCFG